MTYPNVIFNDNNKHPMIAQDLKVLQDFFKDRDVNNLHNCSIACEELSIENLFTASEKPFTEVVSKTKKKSMQKETTIYKKNA